MAQLETAMLKMKVETFEKELKDQINAFAFFGDRTGPKERDHGALAGMVITNSVKVIELNNKLLMAYRNYTKALEAETKSSR